MAQFKFQGHAGSGQAVNGRLEGATAEAVASQLSGRGIVPVKIEPVPLSESYLKHIQVLLGAERVRPVELIMFCRQMYTVTRAGVPLTRGLRGMAASIRHDYFREVLNQIIFVL